ncbi:hypothetical protein CRM22_001651 [Opisthorchis felineus]|uniref:Uncharacterized protein n=1 Tax=Opisthorchis felineus TaxID=147828 RepID=A0A4V6RH71_OPIFE|nr:hypothetical protein CRM22_001651 [Opisthorchis felineus]
MTGWQISAFRPSVGRGCKCFFGNGNLITEKIMLWDNILIVSFLTYGLILIRFFIKTTTLFLKVISLLRQTKTNRQTTTAKWLQRTTHLGKIFQERRSTVQLQKVLRNPETRTTYQPV